MKPSHLFAGSILIVFLSIPGAFGQTSKGFITGMVTERTTGQPVAGARISVADQAEAISGDDGKFRLEIEPGIYDVQISAAGFASITRNQIAVTGGRNSLLDAVLEVTRTEKVDVRSAIFAENVEQSVSNATLTREDIRATPGSGGDPLRVINSQPGVSAASGEFADLIVRGGTAGENLTFIDRIPVGDFTYFTDKYDGNNGGRAAILPPDIFERAEFSAGGFGARYGDRLSSALDVTLRSSNRDRIQGVLFADSGTAGGSVDVPFGKKGGWLFSARRSYIDVALDVAGIAEQGIIGYPRTFDTTNKVIYDLTPRHKLSFTALNFFESFEQTDEQASNIDRRTDRFRMRRTSRRLTFGSTLSSTIGNKTLSQATVWAAGAHNDGTFYLPFTTFLQRSRDLRDSQFGIKEDITSALSSRVRIAAGGGVYFDQANYHTFENSGGFYSPLEEEFFAAARQNRVQLSGAISAYAYGQATGNITEKLSITPGIRVDHYGLAGETKLSPRIAARFNPIPAISLTFSAGVYRQPPDIFVVSLTPNNRDLRTQKADHIVGGVEWLAREDIRVRFEVYRKKYERLILRPLRPTPGLTADGNYIDTGSGEASGFEISAQKALTGFFSGQASYGYVRSWRRFETGGVKFPADFERPHQLTLIGITRFYGFNVAAKYRLASGLPYTRRTPFLLSPIGPILQRIASAADINALRLPNFASLDLRVEKRFGFRRWSFAPYLDYFNITNHNSVVQPNYEFFSPAPFFLSENKRLPIFGLRIEF